VVAKLTIQGLGTRPAEETPLARFFARETSTGCSLLERIRHDLSDLILVCDGQVKQTNESRRLLSDLTKGVSRRRDYATR
jgi:dynein heavy chain 1